jgi:FtsP/CotA-like multicopper oxidase with cupredoxin domain
MLNPVQDPGTSSGQVVRYQVWNLTGAGVTVELKQGDQVIATWSHATLPNSPTIYIQILSPSECDSITDYTNLQIKITGV